jgi:hypothetical protein
MPELSLDHEQRDPFTRHLYSVSMPQLVGREPAPDTRNRSALVKLGADPGRRARPPAGRAAHDAEQSAYRQLLPELQPRVEMRLIPTSE